MIKFEVGKLYQKKSEFFDNTVLFNFKIVKKQKNRIWIIKLFPNGSTFLVPKPLLIKRNHLGEEYFDLGYGIIEAKAVSNIH